MEYPVFCYDSVYETPEPDDRNFWIVDSEMPFDFCITATVTGHLSTPTWRETDGALHYCCDYCYPYCYWGHDFVNGICTGCGGYEVCDGSGTADKPYTGTFDGGNFTISNFSMAVTGNNHGIFGAVSGGTVKNFTIKGKLDVTATIDISDISNIESISNVGGVVGYAINKAVIENAASYVNITDSHIPMRTEWNSPYASAALATSSAT